MATFLLLHGAFQGGWVWKHVEVGLRQLGHETYAPSLRGSESSRTCLNGNRGLESAAQDILDYCFKMDLRRMVLVCHDWSGMIAPLVADKLDSAVTSIVFVNAVVPEPGKSFLDLAGAEFNVPKRSGNDGPFVRPWPLRLFGVAETIHQQWFVNRLTSFPRKLFTAPYAGPEPDKWPHAAYIQYSWATGSTSRLMAGKAKERGAASHEIMCTHNPLILNPGLLTKKLDELVVPAVAPPMHNEPAFSGRACSDMREHDDLRRIYGPRRIARERMAALYQDRKKIASSLHVSES